MRAARYKDEDESPVLVGLDDDSDDSELNERPSRPSRQAALRAPPYQLKLSLTRPADKRTAAHRGVPMPLTRPPAAHKSGVKSIATLLRERRQQRRLGIDSDGRAEAAEMASELASAAMDTADNGSDLPLVGTDETVARLLERDAQIAARQPSWRYWTSESTVPAHNAQDTCPRGAPQDIFAMLCDAMQGSVDASDMLVRLTDDVCVWDEFARVLVRLGADASLVHLDRDARSPHFSSTGNSAVHNLCASPTQDCVFSPNEFAINTLWRVACAWPIAPSDAPRITYMLANLGAVSTRGPVYERVMQRAVVASLDNAAGTECVTAALARLPAEHCVAVICATPQRIRTAVAWHALSNMPSSLTASAASAEPDMPDVPDVPAVPGGATVAQPQRRPLGAMCGPLQDALALDDYATLNALVQLVDYAASDENADTSSLIPHLEHLYRHLRDGRGMDLDASRAKDRVQRLQLRLRYQAWTNTSNSLF
ncbi:hypothetical protein MCUN1_003653 [Malassezia cuniculi]|uniref:Uncharacterized protein n=1 Tax=Malassezia cuniculi TaxID=948313 RepID=A0AAF0JDB8_9BASI|nr:hypothetical protein MCUN1_003653 [Malassezia cuniculi]